MAQEYDVSSDEVRCEDVSEEVVAFYAEKGFRLSFAEEVMRYDLAQVLPQVVMPLEVSYLSWTAERTQDFFRVYTAAFRERPGFPGWSEAEWVEWTAGDAGFRADLSMLAVVDGQERAVGFVTNAEEEAGQGYIIQVGVDPQWRGRGLGAALVAHALRAWRQEGREAVLLDVNVNNPGAIELYRRLGFVVVRRRGKFSRRGVR